MDLASDYFKMEIIMICEHWDGTGIEPIETSEYSPEPCSECNGRKVIRDDDKEPDLSEGHMNDVRFGGTLDETGE